MTWQVNNDMPEFYIYDDSGRLLAKCAAVYATINGTQQIIMHPVKQYIWGPDRVLAQKDALSGNMYYYLYNGHGDVIQITDKNGNIVNSYDYDVWGNFLEKEETIDNPFTYFGQTYDEETGLYYLRARYYDPTTGRFTQQDPAEDGYNWYIYGNQNPVMFVDPSGFAAGDWFLSEEEAAIDFANIYNPKSIKANAEYGAYIYSFEGVAFKNNKAIVTIYYSYGTPVKGQTTGINVESFTKVNGNITSIIHTHGRYKTYTSDETFSEPDTREAKNYNVNIYLATPGGYLKKQNIETFTVERISSQIPFDYKSPDRPWWRFFGGVKY